LDRLVIAGVFIVTATQEQKHHANQETRARSAHVRLFLGWDLS
jgi:hypothetical protein